MKKINGHIERTITAGISLMILLSLSSAQYLQSDTVKQARDQWRYEHIQLHHEEQKTEATDTIKARKDSSDINRCFGTGFLFRHNSLSHI